LWAEIALPKVYKNTKNSRSAWLFLPAPEGATQEAKGRQ
jgi:hypothetical protein